MAERIDDTTWIDDHGCRIVRVHTEGTCAGEHCAIHNPSDHVMSRYPWAMSHQQSALVMRICPHGAEHPDPDSLAYMIDARVKQYQRMNAMAYNADPDDYAPIEYDLAEIADDYNFHDCCDYRCCEHAYPRTWQHRR